jgi:hypothetical protein
MTARPVPRRYWRSYGHDPLPTGVEALDEPFRAFPSWFMRITCDWCGQQRMFSETHSAQGDMLRGCVTEAVTRLQTSASDGDCAYLMEPLDQRRQMARRHWLAVDEALDFRTSLCSQLI